MKLLLITFIFSLLLTSCKTSSVSNQCSFSVEPAQYQKDNSFMLIPAVKINISEKCDDVFITTPQTGSSSINSLIENETITIDTDHEGEYKVSVMDDGIESTYSFEVKLEASSYSPIDIVQDQDLSFRNISRENIPLVIGCNDDGINTFEEYILSSINSDSINKHLCIIEKSSGIELIPNVSLSYGTFSYDLESLINPVDISQENRTKCILSSNIEKTESTDKYIFHTISSQINVYPYPTNFIDGSTNSNICSLRD